MALRTWRRSKTSNWIVRGTLNGREIWESTGTRSKAAAEARRHEIETELRERGATGGRGPTFAEAALTYMEAGRSPRFLAPIIEHFGKRTLLAEIDTAMVNEAAAALYPHAADSTINRQLITPILAVKNFHARPIQKRKGDDQRIRWLTPDEFSRLLVKADPHIRPILMLLVSTGVRTGEALTLQRSDLFLDTGEAYIARAEGRMSKSGRARMVRMPPKAVAYLRATIKVASGPVFRTPKGKPYVVNEGRGGQIQAAFNKARDAAELGADVTPHVLRHTWATWFYAQTRDFGGLMDIGGWARETMANRYRHNAPADLAERLRLAGWDFREQNVACEIRAAAPQEVRR